MSEISFRIKVSRDELGYFDVGDSVVVEIAGQRVEATITETEIITISRDPYEQVVELVCQTSKAMMLMRGEVQ